MPSSHSRKQTCFLLPTSILLVRPEIYSLEMCSRARELLLISPARPRKGRFMPERTQRESPEPRRQVVSFTFYKIQPEWRRLPAPEKSEHRREFASVVGRWRQSEQMT